MKNKAVLWIMIVLFVISSACAGYGFYIHMYNIGHPPAENPNKDFKYYNKLYFYDENKNLIGKYSCAYENCGYAKNMVDDSSYNNKYYRDTAMSEIPLINHRYAFISDNANKSSDSLILYDVVNEKTVKNLTGVKNYTVGISKDYMIVRDDKLKWGVMKMSGNAGLIVECKYDYLGLNARFEAETGLLKADSFIALDGNGWKVISDSDAALSAYSVNQIYDYNDNYVITSTSGYYYLNDSYGNLVLSSKTRGMEFIDNYLKIFNANNECYLIDLNTMGDVTSRYKVSTIDELKTVKTLNGIEVSLNDQLLETVAYNNSNNDISDDVVIE